MSAEAWFEAESSGRMRLMWARPCSGTGTGSDKAECKASCRTMENMKKCMMMIPMVKKSFLLNVDERSRFSLKETCVKKSLTAHG